MPLDLKQIDEKFDKEFKSGSCTCDTVCGIWDVEKYHDFLHTIATEAYNQGRNEILDMMKEEQKKFTEGFGYRPPSKTKV